MERDFAAVWSEPEWAYNRGNEVHLPMGPGTDLEWGGVRPRGRRAYHNLSHCALFRVVANSNRPAVRSHRHVSQRLIAACVLTVGCLTLGSRVLFADKL